MFFKVSPRNLSFLYIFLSTLSTLITVFLHVFNSIPNLIRCLILAKVALICRDIYKIFRLYNVYSFKSIFRIASCRQVFARCSYTRCENIIQNIRYERKFQKMIFNDFLDKLKLRYFSNHLRAKLFYLKQRTIFSLEY